MRKRLKTVARCEARFSRIAAGGKQLFAEYRFELPKNVRIDRAATLAERWPKIQMKMLPIVRFHLTPRAVVLAPSSDEDAQAQADQRAAIEGRNHLLILHTRVSAHCNNAKADLYN